MGDIKKKSLLLGDVLAIAKNNHVLIENDKEYIIAGVQNYGLGIINRRTVTGSELTMKKYQSIEANQLMWCKVDTKNGAFGVTKSEHVGSLASTNMTLANIDISKCLPDFIECLFKIGGFHKAITKASSGSTNRKYLTPTQLLENIEIPNLTINEQKQWLHRIDAINKSELSNNLKSQTTYLSLLRQSILQEAVEGKLTAEWRKKNPELIGGENHASKLLEKIKAEKERLIKEGKIKKDKQHSLIIEDEKPFPLPDEWVWCRLGDIAKIFGGYAYESTSFKKDGINQVLRLGNIRPDQLRLLEKPVFISDELADATLEFWLKPYDILITMTGTRDKRDYLYSVLIDESDVKKQRLYVNQRVGCIRSLMISAYFLCMLLKHDILLDTIFASSTGSANQANIGINALCALSIPLPPLAEQQAIVERVEKLMAIIDELKKQVIERRNQSERLIQSVLREAFTNG